MDFENIGLVLKLKRIENGLLLKDVADKMGMTSNFVSLVENGRRKPSFDFIMKYCKAIDCILCLHWR